MRIALLGTGLIGRFYASAIGGLRARDTTHVVYSRSADRATAFAAEWHVPHATNDMAAAIGHPEVDVVVIGLPNHRHEEAVLMAAAAGKAILCTKPLGRDAREAKRMLDAVEHAGVFHGYLEDLVYTPKTLKAIASVQRGALGRVLWARSREAHPGPHSDWFWDRARSGGGAILDLGCHCIEISRSFIGKRVRPVEVMCWADTLAHPIDAEDNAVGLVRYASGAIGQFEVSWTFRGGMDLRDEVSGTEGTIWLNHWLRTGFDMFSSVGEPGYVAEKLESQTGWMFPVGDEDSALGLRDMFADMLNAIDGRLTPTETFYDGYVVNAIMDAALRSVQTRRWETIAIEDWRGDDTATTADRWREYDADHYLIKEETMPDGRVKLILKEKLRGDVIERISQA